MRKNWLCVTRIHPRFLMWWLLTAISAFAQTTAFNYQGKLTDAGNPANGNYDMQFKLFDTVTVGTGTQQGATVTNPTVQVTAGGFSVTLDFGTNVFTGAARYLEISVRPAGSPNPYTVLSPRQAINSAPYAIQTVNAQQLGGLPASRYVATDTNGNVGIGTASPQSKLEVNSGAGHVLIGAPGCEAGYGGIGFASTLANCANYSLIGNGTHTLVSRPSGGGLFFREANTDQMMIASGGNVGIGTTSPQSPLAVQAFSPGYGITHTDGTVTVGSYIDAQGGWLGTKSNHPLHFFTNDSTPRMTMDTSGNVGIGTTSPGQKLHVVGNSFFDGRVGIGTANPLARLHVEGGSGDGVLGASTNNFGVSGISSSSIGVYGVSANHYGVYGHTDNPNSYAGYFAGNVHVTGTVSQGSDARLKQNISTLTYGLPEVLRLRPVSWRWKAHPESGKQLGLIAQEVEPVLPELVKTDKDAEQLKGLNYTGLIPVLVNAIQQQQQQLEQYHAQLAQQQARDRQQQQELAAIKKLLCRSQPHAALCKAKPLK